MSGEPDDDDEAVFDVEAAFERLKARPPGPWRGSRSEWYRRHRTPEEEAALAEAVTALEAGRAWLMAEKGVHFVPPSGPWPEPEPSAERIETLAAQVWMLACWPPDPFWKPGALVAEARDYVAGLRPGSKRDTVRAALIAYVRRLADALIEEGDVAERLRRLIETGVEPPRDVQTLVEGVAERIAAEDAAEEG